MGEQVFRLQKHEGRNTEGSPATIWGMIGVSPSQKFFSEWVVPDQPPDRNTDRTRTMNILEFPLTPLDQISFIGAKV